MYEYYKIKYPNNGFIDKEFIENYKIIKNVKRSDVSDSIKNIDDYKFLLDTYENEIINSIDYFGMQKYYSGYYDYIYNKYKDKTIDILTIELGDNLIGTHKENTSLLYEVVMNRIKQMANEYGFKIIENLNEEEQTKEYISKLKDKYGYKIGLLEDYNDEKQKKKNFVNYNKFTD